MADKAAGKGQGEFAEAGDEAFQNARLDAIEQFLQGQFGFTPASPPAPEATTEGGEG